MASNFKNFPIHEYQIKDYLGQGAYGTVSLYKKQLWGYFNSSSRLPNKVAVKMFQSSEMSKFSKELENMVRIGDKMSPNIVKFFGACKLQGGKVGLVMELFDKNLMEYIDPPCSLSEARSILRQVAKGLKHLKGLNIVHRDIKPENILVKTDKKNMIQIALTDLGVSKHMTETQRSNQTNIGTDLWMAPEVQGDSPTFGHPADVFGFGLTAMFISTGEWPMGRDVQPDDLHQWVDDCLWVDDFIIGASRTDLMLTSLIKSCLEYEPTKRIGKSDLIEHEFFRDDETDEVFNHGGIVPRIAMIMYDVARHWRENFLFLLSLLFMTYFTTAKSVIMFGLFASMVLSWNSDTIGHKIGLVGLLLLTLMLEAYPRAMRICTVVVTLILCILAWQGTPVSPSTNDADMSQGFSEELGDNYIIHNALWREGRDSVGGGQMRKRVGEWKSAPF